MKLSRNSTLLVAGAASAAILLGGGFAAQHAFAQASDSPESGLISLLATKFNLKQSDVQSVFDQYGKQRHEEMQQKETDRLTKAVTDGSLTQAQKDLIVTRQQEVKTKLDALRADTSKSKDDRKAAMEAFRSEQEDWAKQNNIDMKWLAPPGGHHPGMGTRMHGSPPEDTN